MNRNRSAFRCALRCKSADATRPSTPDTSVHALRQFPIREISIPGQNAAAGRNRPLRALHHAWPSTPPVLSRLARYDRGPRFFLSRSPPSLLSVRLPRLSLPSRAFPHSPSAREFCPHSQRFPFPQTGFHALTPCTDRWSSHPATDRDI